MCIVKKNKAINVPFINNRLWKKGGKKFYSGTTKLKKFLTKTKK